MKSIHYNLNIHTDESITLVLVKCKHEHRKLNERVMLSVTSCERKVFKDGGIPILIMRKFQGKILNWAKTGR